MFRLILDERKKREIDPTLEILRDCVAEAEKSKGDADAREKLAALRDFFETMNACYEQVRRLPVSELAKLAHSGSKLARFLGMKSD